MDDQRSVLIVDPSAETREVLQTALLRRGVRAFSADRATAGLELARRHHPDLVVLDLELDDASQEDLSAPIAEQCRRDETPMIVLGSVRRSAPEASVAQFVAKPYHYAPLVRKIEELLDRSELGEPRPCHRCS